METMGHLLDIQDFRECFERVHQSSFNVPESLWNLGGHGRCIVSFSRVNQFFVFFFKEITSGGLNMMLMMMPGDAQGCLRPLEAIFGL